MARRPRRLPLAVLVPLLAAAACGGGGSPRAGDTPTAAVSGTPSGSPAATASTTGTPAVGTSGSVGATAPGGTASSSQPSGASTVPGSPRPSGSARPKPIDVTLKLAHTCVSPGGTQRADITTLPRAIVVVDTVYSDGKDGQVHGGIMPNGHADDQGRYSFAWTVLPGTPPGQAKTYVSTGAEGGRAGSTNGTFEVKLAC